MAYGKCMETSSKAWSVMEYRVLVRECVWQSWLLFCFPRLILSCLAFSPFPFSFFLLFSSTIHAQYPWHLLGSEIKKKSYFFSY